MRLLRLFPFLGLIQMLGDIGTVAEISLNGPGITAIIIG
jgi:hypothetical protein